jgi:AraC family transcriptional regulator of adaptative response / DNA-3-methyladenine glycosylase II
LIAETSLPLAQIAFAAGFASVRRFNASFRNHYRLTPTNLRRSAPAGITADCLRLTLAYRPPLAWTTLLRFLAARATAGVECVRGDAYHRTVGIGEHQGWLSVRAAKSGHRLMVDLASELLPVLPTVLARLRGLFDLDARPDVIAAHLQADPTLAVAVRRQPGLRVPGAFDSYELGCRAILGQQVSVKAASTLAGRLAERHGQPIVTPLPCLNRIAPTAEDLASVPTAALTRLGLTAARAETLRVLAKAVLQRQVDLQPGADAGAVEQQLLELPGIGPWTAQYIAMRGLHWPDAFPAGDLGLLKAAGVKSASALERTAERWRPWRSYAAMHLWESLQ